MTRRALLFAACLVSLVPPAGASDTLQKGATERGLHSGAGLAVPGGRGDRSYWMLAGRWGRVLTGDHFSGRCRGNLEYGIEGIPVLIMFQSSTVYATGFTPVLLRWNFTSRRRVAPFIEAGAGILLSTSQIPEGTSRFNFIDQGTVGLQFFGPQKRSWQVGARYLHISNAGIADHNAGVNSVYLFAGFSWWK